MDEKETDVNRVFSALGDGTRRAMLERLGAGPMSVSHLAEPMKMTLAAVVQHLQVLEESGLVVTEKTGRVRTCRVEARGLRAAEEWLRARRPMWDQRLDDLADLLTEAPDKDAGESEMDGKTLD